MNEHSGEFSGREDKFGDEIDGVISFFAQVEVGGRSGLSEFLVQLDISAIQILESLKKGDRGDAHLVQVERSRITTIIVISIHMEHFLPIDREQSREDTFGETGSLTASGSAVKILGGRRHTRTITCYQR